MIKSCKELNPHLKETIEDEGIEIDIEKSLNQEKIAIIKVDEYYNDLHLASPPKSIDFARFVVDCECAAYVCYLLELKNVNSPAKLNVKGIQEKFTVTIEDFLTKRFGRIFLADQFKYKDIKLYLVSDAYRNSKRICNI